jgi:hypothetical protein
MAREDSGRPLKPSLELASRYEHAATDSHDPQLRQDAQIERRAGNSELLRGFLNRYPNPSTAYSQSIKAVEVAAKGVISPTNDKATLGTMIADIRNKPEKWSFVLDKSGPEDVMGMMQTLWKGQEDRHGTDAPDAPLAVDQAEADAAFHLALALSRFFSKSLIHPA